MLIGVVENGKTFDATDREEVEGRFLEAFSVNVSMIFC